MTINQYLESFLNRLDIPITLEEEINYIINQIQELFNYEEIDVMTSGSYAKNTTIYPFFDIDLIISYPNNWGTIKEVFNDVYETLCEDKDNLEYDDLRKQYVSIGLFFELEYIDLSFDIIPARRINDSGDLKLSIQKNIISKLFSSKRQETKTNIIKQNKNLKQNKSIIKVFRLIKYLCKKKYHGFLISQKKINIKSFYLELLFIEIKNRNKYELSKIRSSLKLKILFYLEYLYKHIKYMKIVDPGKPNNIVSDLYDDNEKSEFASFFKEIYDELLEDDDNFYEYFNESELLELQNEY